MTNHRTARTPAARTRTLLLLLLSMVAALSALGLALPSGSVAATVSWGSSLSGTPSTSVNTASIAPDGSDLALWNTQSSAGPTAPSGGQVLGVKIKGCAVRTPGAPTTSGGAPVNTINFQTLTKQGGSYTIGNTAPNFQLPFCSTSDNGAPGTVNTNTVTTFQPIHLCINAGDALAWVDLGDTPHPHRRLISTASRST